MGDYIIGDTCRYDLILGQYLLEIFGMSLDFGKQTFTWDDFSIDMKLMSFIDRERDTRFDSMLMVIINEDKFYLFCQYMCYPIDTFKWLPWLKHLNGGE